MDTITKHQVGAVLAKLIKINNLDETSLAKACNISIASLSRIKNNPSSNPTISTLRPIAEYFNITIDQLLGYSPLNLDSCSNNNQSTNSIMSALNKRTNTIKNIPIIEHHDISQWLAYKTTHNPIEHWLNYTISSICNDISDKSFATTYRLENNPEILQNCLIIVDPIRAYQHDDLILIYNNIVNKFFLRIIAINDANKIFLKPIESGYKDYTSLDSCVNNIKIIGVVIESRLQYKIAV